MPEKKGSSLGKALLKVHNCETCAMRAYAQRRPDSVISKVWRWHQGWCPAEKAYQAQLAEDAEKES